jgi:outer membrane protein OmpA-like peptidoglycan-associated protein
MAEAPPSAVPSPQDTDATPSAAEKVAGGASDAPAIGTNEKPIRAPSDSPAVHKDTVSPVKEAARPPPPTPAPAMHRDASPVLVTFSTSSYVVSAEGLAEIKSKFFPAGADAVFIVDGHSDQRGSEAVNEALALARARAVAALIVKSGVPASRVKVRSFGSTQPVDTGSSNAAMAKNRRVEISLNRSGN